MSVTVLQGDCRDVLAGMEAESFAACCTDPPYHLTSIVKRFGGENAAPVKVSEFFDEGGKSKGSSPYLRASKGFMGKTWDGGDVAFRPETWAAVLRVLKPGAYLVAFASTRGYHRMVCAIEDAGFVIHPMLGWIFGSGFPKAHDLSKAIDRAAGAEREVVFNGGSDGVTRAPREMQPGGGDRKETYVQRITSPATDAARQWQGWAYGLQSLKPALEPICLAQKPFADVTSDEIHDLTGWDHWCSSRSDGDDRIITARSLRPDVRSYRARLDKHGCEVAREDLGDYAPFALDGGTANVLRHGTGALNIDAGRVGTGKAIPASASRHPRGTLNADGWGYNEQDPATCSGHDPNIGRWPANLAHDGSPEVMEAFGRFGERTSGSGDKSPQKHTDNAVYGAGLGWSSEPSVGGDTGTAARFFFCGKAQPWEREGQHPTVKPVALMEWLVKLVTPPDGTVLDPFCGTGSTLVACDWLGIDAVGIEQDAQTCRDAETKIKRLRARRLLGDAPRYEPLPGQASLFDEVSP